MFLCVGVLVFAPTYLPACVCVRALLFAMFNLAAMIALEYWTVSVASILYVFPALMQTATIMQNVFLLDYSTCRWKMEQERRTLGQIARHADVNDVSQTRFKNYI